MAEKVREDKGIFKKNLVRAVVFLCIIAAAVCICCRTFGFADAERSNLVLEQYYDLEPNSVDVVYFGSSAVQRGYVVPQAFHERGVAAYSYTCGTQPFVLTRFFMEETLKTQTPKLFLVELRGSCKGADDLAEVAVRRMIDNMKPSRNKYEAINYITDYAENGENEVDTTGLSYYFPLLKYHSRWNPSKQPKHLRLDYYKGYGLDPDWSFTVRTIHPLPYDKVQEPIAPETEEALNDLLDYCDQLPDTRVLFVTSPYEASELGMHKLNYTTEIIEKRGYEVLDCLPAEVREGMGLNDETCYYNREHLNYYGSLLYTSFLTDYIQDKYDLPDRRGDAACKAWEDDFQRLQDNLQGEYNKSYNKMMRKINRRIEKQKEEKETGAK